MNITANAAASSSVLPSGGIELTLAKGNKLESLSTGTNSTKQIESIIETVIRDDQMDTTPEASEEEEPPPQAARPRVATAARPIAARER